MISIDKAGEVLFVDLPKNPVAFALLILGALVAGGLAVYGAKKFMDELAERPETRAELAKLVDKIEQPELRAKLRQLLEQLETRRTVDS